MPPADGAADMITVHVAAVGDGACAAVMTAGGERPAMIIDCGSQAGAREAVAGLERIVDLSRSPSTTLVVTHLHRDHFNGFLSLASIPGRRHAFGTVNLVQARLPYRPTVAPFTMRFLALQLYLGEASGIPDLDFPSSIRRASRGKLVRDPKSAGETFVASGHTFEVLWPPRELTRSLSARVRRAVDTFDGLADGDPKLREALDRVLQSGLVPVDESGWDARPEGPVVHEQANDADGLGSEEGSDVVSLHGLTVNPSRRGSSPGLTGEVAQAALLFRHAANDMSLVFATPRRDFMAWGDVSSVRARRIAEADVRTAAAAPRARRSIALAPDHGSHGPTPLSGDSQLCVSQHGRGLYGKWHGRRADVPEACLSTYEEGDIFIREHLY
jgi:hypothetical protein